MLLPRTPITSHPTLEGQDRDFQPLANRIPVAQNNARTLVLRYGVAFVCAALAVRDRVGTISTQAVYDVLGALTRADLARRIEPAGSPARYEARVGDNHHHAVCRACGAIVIPRTPVISSLIRYRRGGLDRRGDTHCAMG